MARVPTKTVPEGQTRGGTVFQDVRASAEDFGAAEGRALQGVGKALQVEAARHTKATDRIQRRQEAVDRVRALQSAEQEMKAAFQEVVDKGDNFGSPESVAAFNTRLSQIAQQAMGQHRGRPESQLILEGGFVSLTNKFGDLALTQGAAEGRAIQARQLTQFQGELAGEVSNGLPIDQAFARNAAFAVQYADSQTPSETEAAIASGQEQVIVAAISRSLNLVDTEEARKVLNANDKFLSKGVRQTMNDRLVVMETVGARKAAELDAELGSLEKAVRRKLTPAEVLKFKGAFVKPALTTAEKVKQAEDAVGPLTDDQRDKVAGAFIAEDEAKALTPGRGRSILNNIDLLQGFAQNTLEPTEELEAQAALAAALIPTIDPITKEVRPGILPPAWINALAMRGMTPDQFINFGAAPQGQSTQPGQAAPPAGTQVAPSPEARAQPGQAGPSSSSGAQPKRLAAIDSVLSTAPVAGAEEATASLKDILREVAPFVFAGDNTFYDLGKDFTGLIPSAQRGFGRLPGVGTLLGGGKTAAELKTFIPGAFRQLVEILRVNARSQAEAEEIKSELNVDPSIIDNEEAYKRRMIGVSKSLALREKLAALALQGPLGPAEHRRLLFFHSLISQFRTVITPPLIAGENRADTIKQVEKFFTENPPGTRFLFRTDDDEWIEDVVPEGGGEGTAQ